MVRRKKNKPVIWVIVAIAFVGLLLVAQRFYNRYLYRHSEANLSTVERTWLNYSEDALKAGVEFNISPEYLLALIALECNGFKEVPSRFEPHVFVKLQELRDGEEETYESISANNIANSSDEALKNLASSWGPFQLMGYQCLYLDIKLKEMRGKNAVKHGARWIRNAYGKYLDKRKFKDAFHLHNTGKPYPKIGPPRTHNRRYVPRGIKYMKEFGELIVLQQSQTN